MKTTQKLSNQNQAKRGLLKALILVLAVTQISKCNVWDNLYSKFDQDAIILKENIHKSMKLKQFSNLGISLEIDFLPRADQLRLSIHSKALGTLSKATRNTKEDKDGAPATKKPFFSLLLDFEKQVAQFTETTQNCLQKPIPEAARLNLTDFGTIWMYSSYFVGSDEPRNLLKYELQVEELGRFVTLEKTPSMFVYLKEAEKKGNGVSWEELEVKLIQEKLRFVGAASTPLGDERIEQVEDCIEDEEEFRKKVREASQVGNGVGIVDIARGLLTSVMDRFTGKGAP